MTTLAQVDYGSSVEEFGQTLGRVLPQVVLFLVILVAGYFIAKAVGGIVDKVLERVGFNRAVERGGIGRALERTKYHPSDILGKIAFYALMLFVLQLAFGVFGPNPISDLITGVIAYLPNLFVAIVIVVVAAAIAAAVKEIVEASLGGLSYGRGLAVAASTAILVIGGFAALDQLQVAEDIVNTLFIALVATVAGSAIVAVGGGGVTPMRDYWERTLNRVEEEAPRVREEARGAQDRIRERAEDRADHARSALNEGRGETARPSAAGTYTEPAYSDPASSSRTWSGAGDETAGTRTAPDPDRTQRPVTDDRTQQLSSEGMLGERDARRRDVDESDLTQPLRQPRYDDEPPRYDDEPPRR